MKMPSTKKWIELCGGEDHLRKYYLWYIKVNGWTEEEFSFEDWKHVEYQLHEDALFFNQKEWEYIKNTNDKELEL